MPTTPTYAFRYPSPTDPADGPQGFQNLATDVESVLGVQLPIAGGIRKLGEVTLGANAATMDISSIPATAAHMLVVGTFRNTLAGILGNLWVRVNGATTNYLTEYLRISGANVAAAGQSVLDVSAYLGVIPAASANPGSRSQLVWFIGDYTRNEAKNMIGLAGSVADGTVTNQTITAMVNLYNVAGAVNRLTFVTDPSASFTSGCRATVYGLG